MMKYFLLCILIGVAIQGSAQTLEATIVTGDNEASVVIDRRAWRDKKQIEVIDPPSLNLSIIDYAMIEGIRYVLVEPVHIQELQGAEETELVLLEVLISGTISLYQINDEKRLFVSKEGSYSELTRAPNVQGKLQDVFRHTLHTLIEDCPAISSQQIGKLNFTEVALRGIVRMYNDACGVETHVRKTTKFSFGPVVGYKAGEYNSEETFPRLGLYFTELRSVSGIDLKSKDLGCAFNFRNPLKLNGIEIQGSVMYSRISGKRQLFLPDPYNHDFFDDRQLSLEFDMLEFNVGPRIAFGGRHLTFLAGVGLKGSYRLQTKGKSLKTKYYKTDFWYTSEVVLDDSEFGKFTNALNVDFGVRYKRVYAELTYSSGLNEYFNIAHEISHAIGVRGAYYLN